MSYVAAKDISQWNGNWQDTGEPIVLIKMSGGDDGLYMDSHAASNYAAAVAAGKAVGGYHFGGGVLSAEAEAAYFLKAMSPLAENDVFSLDIEAHLATRPDVVQWADDFIDYMAGMSVHGGLLYMNLSTLLAHDWSGPLSKWGLWLADWAVSPDATIPTHYTYVMQQYNDGPNYDHDAWFGTVEQFRAYGYHAKETPSEPTPQPTPEPTPAPVTSNPKGDTPPETPAVPPADSQPTSNPPAAEKPAAPKTPPKVIVPEPHTYFTLWQLTVAIIKRLWGIFFGAK